MFILVCLHVLIFFFWKIWRWEGNPTTKAILMRPITFDKWHVLNAPPPENYILPTIFRQQCNVISTTRMWMSWDEKKLTQSGLMCVRLFLLCDSQLFHAYTDDVSDFLYMSIMEYMSRKDWFVPTYHVDQLKLYGWFWYIFL